jgi:hypothetical protein
MKPPTRTPGRYDAESGSPHPERESPAAGLLVESPCPCLACRLERRNLALAVLTAAHPPPGLRARLRWAIARLAER